MFERSDWIATVAGRLGCAVKRRAIGARTMAALVLAGAAAIGSTAEAQVPRETTSRLIVKLREPAAIADVRPAQRIVRLAHDEGIDLRHERSMALGAELMALGRFVPVDQAEALAARIAARPDVEFAVPDRRRTAERRTNDSYLTAQAYLDNDAYGISAFAAWDTTTGTSDVVVAIIDTGYRPHIDMTGRFLPGYDFIADLASSNDGNGRDADALDPGDWTTEEDVIAAGGDCDLGPSSWHGTEVAGVVAANSNNGQWTAGINWNAKILPVRVLGKCGGWDSDIADGIAWAAGVAVPGVPANPNPAQVINLSLGGSGACTATYRNAITAAYAHGVTRAIVVAAGNASEDVAFHSPANCSNVLAIASTTSTGMLASYSDYGAGVTLSAPGGDYDRNLGTKGITALSNTGFTTPGGDTIRTVGGTSFAAPMVSGVVSLMLGVAPSLTAQQVRSILTSTAKPFITSSNCSTAICGAGLVDASAAVLAAKAVGGTAPAAVNYQGLWWKAPAATESGWGINFAHQGDVIFATWFTYDTTGKAWWLTMTANKTAEGVYAGTLYETRGPAYNAVPFDPAAVSSIARGIGTLSFTDVDHGTLHYLLDGVEQTKAIARQVFAAPVPTCAFGAQTDLTLATNYQDLWWNANESGWGINFTEQGGVIFATWFTYDADGKPMWLSATAAPTGARSFAGTLYRTSGPAFSAVPFDPAAVQRTEVGTMTLTFANGNSAAFHYEIGAVSQTKAITRQVFRAPGTVCQ
jgi:serine protease